jgi:hypothetical protein
MPTARGDDRGPLELSAADRKGRPVKEWTTFWFETRTLASIRSRVPRSRHLGIGVAPSPHSGRPRFSCPLLRFTDSPLPSGICGVASFPGLPVAVFEERRGCGK